MVLRSYFLLLSLIDRFGGVAPQHARRYPHLRTLCD